MNEEDTHRKLLELFYEYVKSNLKWEKKETHSEGIKIRKILVQIQKQAYIRRNEIQEIRAKKPRINYPLTLKKPQSNQPKEADD